MYELELEMCRELLKRSNAIKKAASLAAYDRLEVDVYQVRRIYEAADEIRDAVLASIRSINEFIYASPLDKYKSSYYKLHQKDGEEKWKQIDCTWRKLKNNKEYLFKMSYKARELKRKAEEENAEIA